MRRESKRAMKAGESTIMEEAVREGARTRAHFGERDCGGVLADEGICVQICVASRT